MVILIFMVSQQTGELLYLQKTMTKMLFPFYFFSNESSL